MPDVIDLLRARAAAPGRPFADGARIALVVEGGAMRGVVSAGMVAALEHLGLTQAFDVVYGSSAGAINAAYFLAGQAALGTRIYYEDINNARFISRARLLTRRPVLDLGFLLDEVTADRKRLDVDRLLTGPTPLRVLATAVSPPAAVTLADFRSREELLDALRASATMPILAGRPALFRGEAFFDASLTEPIAVPTAEADGCSHALVLLTRPDNASPEMSWLDRAVVLPRLHRISPDLATRYRERSAPYAALLAAIAAGTGPLGRVQVTGVRPAPPVVARLERDRGLLRAAAQRGASAVLDAFGGATTHAVIH